MSDLRSRLERIGDRVRVAPDAFERLERARRRRERNRRLTAGAVALLVAIGGTVAAFTAFRTSDGAGTVARTGGSGVFALWPERTAEGLAAAQAAVDAGDPDLAWRLDPNEVARRFAFEVLQWPAVTVTRSVDAEPAAGGDRFLDVTVPPGSSCDQIVAGAPCPTTSLTLKVQQLGGLDGVWSVVQVESPDLALPISAGVEVASGTTITVPTVLPEGTKVSMGVAFASACDVAGSDENVAVMQGLLRFSFPRVPDGCIGYVYAIDGPGALTIGRFLFSDAPDRPDVGYMLDQIAAVPVLFTHTPAASSNVAEFTCDESGTISPSTVDVDAQPDGVHVAVTNTADERISFTVGGGESTMYVVGQGGAQPGERKEIVVALPPGHADVSCVLGSKGGIDTSPIADLRVADPAGSYIPIGMDCPTSSQAPDHVPGATGFQGDPVEVARQHLSGLEYDDSVERAGYPSGEEPIVRVVRNGDVVAMATFSGDGHGGWLVDTVAACVNTLIGWSDEVTGVSGPVGSPNPPTAWDQLCARARADGPGTADNGSDLRIQGRDSRFDPRCLIAPAGEPLTIRFDNGDAGILRNLAIYEITPYLRQCIVTGTAPAQGVGRPLFRGEILEGVDEIAYSVDPLEPGEYYFQDDVHPMGNGVLVVE